MHIKMTKSVTFRDRLGNMTAFYPEGSVVEATSKTENAFITTMGGIYFDEAAEYIHKPETTNAR